MQYRAYAGVLGASSVPHAIECTISLRPIRIGRLQRALSATYDTTSQAMRRNEPIMIPYAVLETSRRWEPPLVGFRCTLDGRSFARRVRQPSPRIRNWFLTPWSPGLVYIQPR